MLPSTEAKKMNRVSREMTVSEAGMYMAWVSREDWVDGLYPASMGTPFRGRYVWWAGHGKQGYNHSNPNGSYGGKYHSGDIHNATDEQIEWAHRRVSQLENPSVRVSDEIYVTLYTTQELLDRWDGQNEHGGPCLYWP